MKKIKLSNILKEAYDDNKDYSQYEKTFASWLKKEKGVKVLEEIITDAIDVNDAKSEIVDKVSSIAKEKGLHISDKYITKLKVHLGSLKTKNALMQYIYNIYLKGLGFGLDKN